MVTAFFATEMIVDLVFEKEVFREWIIEDFAWPAIFGATLIFCLTVRFFKKHTDCLKVAGR
jgi:NhaP-type Na+/H+ or K+/H+ antiporter